MAQFRIVPMMVETHSTKMETPVTRETRQLTLVRNLAFGSLFLFAIFDGLLYPVFANAPLFHWMCFMPLIGLPLAIWQTADSFIRQLDVLPWEPLAAFLLWPVVLPRYLYKTHGWAGIGLFCGVCAAMYGLKLVAVASSTVILLVLYGFPGPATL